MAYAYGTITGITAISTGKTEYEHESKQAYTVKKQITTQQTVATSSTSVNTLKFTSYDPSRNAL
jgi:hypothetical protein